MQPGVSAEERIDRNPALRGDFSQARDVIDSSPEGLLGGTPVRAVERGARIAQILSLPCARFGARGFGWERADFCAGRRLRLARPARFARADDAPLRMTLQERP